MIKRELYMSRIRPFIGTELIKQELTESGVSPMQFVSINFEDMSYSHLQTAQSLHDEITGKAAAMEGKVYLFFDEIQEVRDWEKYSLLWYDSCGLFLRRNPLCEMSDEGRD